MQPVVPEGAPEDMPLGPGAIERPPAVIGITKAIETAIGNSREYQARKEDVYLSALDLTLERHNWSPIFSGLLSGRWQRENKEESWAGDADFGVTQLLASGASTSLSLSTELLRYVTGEPRTTAASVHGRQVSGQSRASGYRRIRNPHCLAVYTCIIAERVGPKTQKNAATGWKNAILTG